MLVDPCPTGAPALTCRRHARAGAPAGHGPTSVGPTVDSYGPPSNQVTHTVYSEQWIRANLRDDWLSVNLGLKEFTMEQLFFISSAWFHCGDRLMSRFEKDDTFRYSPHSVGQVFGCTVRFFNSSVDT